MATTLSAYKTTTLSSFHNHPHIHIYTLESKCFVAFKENLKENYDFTV